MKEAFICDAARTPIGRYGGALSGVRTGGQFALCTMCVGVGQGIALVIERV